MHVLLIYICGFCFQTKEYELKMEETTLSQLPFTLIDTRGIEEECGNGMKINDIIRILQGHIKVGYNLISKINLMHMCY